MTIGGVDVGGMEADEAERAVRRQLLAPLRHSLKVGYEGRVLALCRERGSRFTPKSTRRSNGRWKQATTNSSRVGWSAT